MEDNKKTIVETQTTDNTQTTATTKPEVDYEKLYREAVANQEKERKYAQDLKAKLREKLTEDEKKKAELEERENYYKSIERENKFIKFRLELANSINDTNVLDEVSNLLVDGDILNAISKINAHINGQKESYEKKLKEATLTNNPIPPAGSSTPPVKDWRAMSIEEWNILKETNPIEYKKLLEKIK